MCKDFSILFSNFNFLFISAIYALMYTVYAGMGFVVGSLFAPFSYSGFDISLVGVVFVFVGTRAVLFCGIYLDKTNKYLFILRMISVTSTLAMASSILLIPTGNIWCALLFCVLAGACIIPIVPVCYALATEVTHPV
jgi:MFS family permease